MAEIIDTLGGILVVVIPIVLFILLLKLLPSKGAIGEKRVAHILKKLPEDRYKVINNLLIQNNGHKTQIDHIVVSVYGIFVIETKTYQGWIYGGENSDYWTQNIYGNKYLLRNPIHQNYGHIKAVKNILDEYPGLPYISIVAFSRHSECETEPLPFVPATCMVLNDLCGCPKYSSRARVLSKFALYAALPTRWYIGNELNIKSIAS